MLFVALMPVYISQSVGSMKLSLHYNAVSRQMIL